MQCCGVIESGGISSIKCFKVCQNIILAIFGGIVRNSARPEMKEYDIDPKLSLN